MPAPQLLPAPVRHAWRDWHDDLALESRELRVRCLACRRRVPARVFVAVLGACSACFADSLMEEL